MREIFRLSSLKGIINKLPFEEPNQVGFDYILQMVIDRIPLVPLYYQYNNMMPPLRYNKYSQDEASQSDSRLFVWLTSTRRKSINEPPLNRMITLIRTIIA
jgi:hypothetical protein